MFTKETGKQVGKYALDAGCKAVKYSAKYVYRHRKEISGALVGAVKEMTNTVKGAKGLSITTEEIEAELREIQKQSAEYHYLSTIYKDILVNSPKYKDIIFESIIASSTAIAADIIDHTIPKDVQLVYELAYPQLSKNMTLEEIIADASPVEAQGYMAAIKGKLFEIQYVDYLNNTPNVLPDGYTAKLAETATNPGWDIQIVDVFGNIDKVYQLKATDSLDYIQDAYMKYPEINIVTTNEVYEQIAMHDLAVNVIDSGISNEQLTEIVSDTFFNSDIAEYCLAPAAFPYLLNLYLAQKKVGLTEYEKGKEFGSRSFRTWFLGSIGAAVGSAVCAPLGLIAAPAAGVLLKRGQTKYNYLKELREMRNRNRQTISWLIEKTFTRIAPNRK